MAQTSEPIERVLFVGLGMMGEPMAARVATDFDLIVNDVDAPRASRIAEALGTRAAASALDVADQVDAVVLMLPNSAIVESLLLEAGLLAAVQPGTLIIDMSSSRPASTRELAAVAERHGVDFVDAPVSGGKARAVTGELAIMVGGTDSGKARAHALLSIMGTSITDTGAPGSGHAMKALNNLLSATGLIAACEVLLAGARFGLSPEVMLEVLNHSTGRNHATEVKLARYVLSRSFDDSFALDLMVKDLRTAVDLLDGAVTEPSVTRTAADAWQHAQKFLDDPRAGHTAVARWVESASGIEIHG